MNPDTAITWLIARLAEYSELTDLLGGAHVYQAGEAPEEADCYIVIAPPPEMRVRVWAGRFPQTVEGVFRVWAETHTDRLPPGKALDDALTPIAQAVFAALLGEGGGVSPTGGAVHGIEFLSFHTPQPVTDKTGVQTGQKGLVIRVTAS